jgi:hypothetical protein
MIIYRNQTGAASPPLITVAVTPLYTVITFNGHALVQVPQATHCPPIAAFFFVVDIQICFIPFVIYYIRATIFRLHDYKPKIRKGSGFSDLWFDVV